MHTAQGFTHTPSEHLTGTYHIQSASDGGQGQLVIDWHGGGTEGWVLSGFGSGGKLAELEAGAQSSSSKRAGVSYADYTGGFAYGSNTPLDVRRTLKSAQAGGNVGQEAWTWARDTITHVKEGRTGPTRRGYNLHAFRSCAGSECLTWTHRSSNSVNGPCSRGAGCPAKGGPGGDDTIQYYIARVGADRRDTEWHWCTCLAREHGETCYSRNSHVQPMLQVLDDDGVFRGWVGVEASFYNSPARKNPDGSIEDRTLSDSLAVFRRMR
ncbi:hypothetical protein [Streptomyces coeruleorubidus]|uniref:hypothetical protein n=1 Tax=Streptomyces coeruleorubidus TaxID=116188 RepID=UPI00339FDC83